MTSSQLEWLLDQFSSANSIELLQPAADALSKGKLVNAARLDPRFALGIEKCLNVPESGIDVLSGISIAYRLGAASKPAMGIVRGTSSGLLLRPLPPLSLLTNGKDRYYVTLALSDAEGDWVNSYIAHSITDEDSAELARRELTNQLFSKLPLSDGLALIADAFRQIAFETEKPAESAAKRLRRIIAAIRPSITRHSLVPGDSLGLSLRALFDSPSRFGQPVSGERPWKELATESCGLVSDILRTQLTVLADPEIYRSLQPAKAWVGPQMWPRFCKQSAAAQAVSTALQDSIVLLAKQGVTDQRLLDTLEFVVGARDAAASIASKLASDNPGLDADVRDWLTRFGRERTSPLLDSFKKASDADIDTYVASLLLSVLRLEQGLGSSQARAAIGTRTEYAHDIERLVLDVKRLASIRNIATRLQPGEIVEYLPAAHELLGGHRMGVRQVRVVQQLVERLGADGVPVVVQRAIVETIGE